MEHFDAKKALELIEKEKITIPAVVPTQLAMMLNHPDFDKYDLTSVRVMYSGGAPMPTELARAIVERAMRHSYEMVFPSGSGIPWER